MARYAPQYTSNVPLAGSDGEVRGHPPGRRAQHAEFHAAPRARALPHASAAQTRDFGDHRGVAAVGGVHPGRRQHERHAVRARHPHLRELHAQHARHFGDSRRAETQSPPDPGRPEPRDRPARQGDADGARGGRRRGGRPAHRSALRSGSRPQRRRAVAVPVAVRSPDGGAADHRARHRPQHLPRARRAPGMEPVIQSIVVSR